MSNFKKAKLLILSAPILLGGCFDSTTTGTVAKDGSLSGKVELAVSMQLLGMLAAEDKGAKDPFADCGKPTTPPAGVTASSERGMKTDASGQPMMTCTYSFKIADPIKHFTEAKARNNSTGGLKVTADLQNDFFANGVFERLGTTGYHMGYTFHSPAQSAKDKENASGPAGGMIAAMLANHYFTFSITGQKIENTTGILNADGKTVTWKIPVAVLMNENFSQELRADVYYADPSLTEMLKGKLKEALKALF